MTKDAKNSKNSKNSKKKGKKKTAATRPSTLRSSTSATSSASVPGRSVGSNASAIGRSRAASGRITPTSARLAASRQRIGFTSDHAAWMKLPADRRPDFTQFQRQRRDERWASIQRTLDAPGASRSPSSFRRLDGSSFSPSRRVAPARPSGGQRLRAASSTSSLLASMPTPEQEEIARLKRELAKAKAQNRKAMETSASSFRTFLRGIIGNVVTTLTLGTLRGVWKLAFGVLPFF